MKRLVKSLKSVAQPQASPPGQSSTYHPKSSDFISTGEFDEVVDLSRYIKRNEEHCVGGGRFGDVYKGFRTDRPGHGHSAEDRRVAIKVIRPLMVRKDIKSKVIKRLTREIAVWQGLAHENIVPFLGLSYSFGSMPALISVWMENGQLDVYLSEHPGVDRSAIAEGVASGLLYLHTRDPKIIHGDVKTANTLVDRAGNARLCDFGLSRMMAEDDLWMTTTVNSRGSVRWMAPELLEGIQVLPTPESDVYALAMTILEMITGRIPFYHHHSDHLVTLAILFQKEIPGRPTEIDKSDLWQVDLDELWECLTRCWGREPERRPSVAVVGELFRSGRESRTPVVIPLEPFRGHTKEVTSIAFSPDGTRILSGSWDATVRLWDAQTGEVVLKLNVSRHGGVYSVAFSPDGKRIAAGTSALLVWDSDTGDVVSKPFTSHTGHIFFHSVAFSPDGKCIAAGSDTDTVRIWDVETGKLLLTRQVEGHTERVTSLTFSPDGRWIASGSYGSMVRVWNAVTGELLSGPFEGHVGKVISIAFFPDGKRIASASDRYDDFWVWDAETGTLLRAPIAVKTEHVTSAAFSLDCKRVTSGSWDGTVHVWNAEKREALLAPFERHTGRITSVAFSWDGKRIASGSTDRTVRVWNAEIG